MIPNDRLVRFALFDLWWKTRKSAPAVDLCERLMELGFTKAEGQLGIQRAVDNGSIFLMDDWTLYAWRE